MVNRISLKVFAAVFLALWSFAGGVLVAADGLNIIDMEALYEYGLDTENLPNELPESWKPWATALDEELLTLSFPEELSLDEQFVLVEKLRKRVETMRGAMADPRFRPIHERLITLEDPLSRRLDWSEAVLGALRDGVVPVPADQRAKEIRELWRSAQNLQAGLSNRPQGEEWKTHFALPQLIDRLAEPETSVKELSDHLAEIEKRYEDTEEMTAAQLRLLRSNDFWSFRRGVAKVQAILNRQDTPADKTVLEKTLQEFVAALVGLDFDHRSDNVQQLRLSRDRLVLLNPANEKRLEFLDRRYAQRNFHGNASERIFQYLVYNTRNESGQIAETVMGAQLYGNTVTNAATTIDLVPSANSAKASIKLTGEVKANTVLVQKPVKIYTTGNSQFWAEKNVMFDGFRFTPSPAQISVKAIVVPYDASTPVSCFPVFGQCIDDLVLNKAIERRGEAEQQGRQKVAETVVPELNREVDRGLTDGNAQLQEKVFARLAAQNLSPRFLQAWTTETQLMEQGSIGDAVELSGGAPPSMFQEEIGLTLQIHESLLNNMADRMNLAGRTMTPEEIREEISRFLSELTGRTLTFAAPAKPTNPKADNSEDGESKFILDATTPVWFHIRNNQVELTLRAGLSRPNGMAIEPHDMTIPLQFELTPSDVRMKVGTVSVHQFNRNGNAAKNSVMRQKIEQEIQPSTFSRFIDAEPQPGKPIKFRVQRIKALAGWLSVWTVPVNSAEETPATP